MSDEKKYMVTKNFYELSDSLKLQVLIRMMVDAGYDPTKWFFNVTVNERELTIKELEDACKTAVEIEDYEKASLLRDVIQRKRENIN